MGASLNIIHIDKKSIVLSISQFSDQQFLSVL